MMLAESGHKVRRPMLPRYGAQNRSISGSAQPETPGRAAPGACAGDAGPDQRCRWLGGAAVPVRSIASSSCRLVMPERPLIASRLATL
jgi:hypothetical protein